MNDCASHEQSITFRTALSSTCDIVRLAVRQHAIRSHSKECDWTRTTFLVFLCGSVVLWTLIATLTWPNLTLDQSETIFWGHEWQLGTTKHPPLTAWICEAVTVVFGSAVWAQYLVARLTVAAGIWAVWKLAREQLSPTAALFSACLLECCLFYTIKNLHLNNNIGLHACWPCCIYCFYKAIRTQQLRYWLAVGLWLGLGLLVKYTTGLLALVMLVFGVWNRDARKSWRTPGPYLAILLSALIFVPHVQWLVNHDFCTIRQLSIYASRSNTLLNHLANPFEFGINQLIMLVPMLVPLIAFNNWSVRFSFAKTRDPFFTTFVSVMFFSPILIHLFVALFSNLRMSGSYGSPLWMLIGVWIMNTFEFRRNETSWNRAWTAWAVTVSSIAVIWTVATMVDPFFNERIRTLFPGRDLASAVDAIWRKRYDRPLPAIAGNYFLCGNVSFFNPDRPRVFQIVRGGNCPWMTDDEFRRSGGIFVWDRDEFPKHVQCEALDRFEVTETIHLAPLRYQTNFNEHRAFISIAIVPPADFPAEEVSRR